MHVILDPGHGGTDSGTTRGAIVESHITLSVAQLVAEELRNDKTFKVSLTRNDNSYLSLEERAEIANKKGDVFLSIHVNSSTDKRVQGKEIYFQNQLPSDEESLFLANRENIGTKGTLSSPRSVSLNIKSRPNLNPDVKSIIEDLERNQRLKLSGLFTESLFKNWGGNNPQHKHTIQQAPFFVISNVDKPAALIEIGFLSNDEEAKKLVDEDYQKKIAHGIYLALVHFKEFIDKPTAKSLN